MPQKKTKKSVPNSQSTKGSAIYELEMGVGSIRIFDVPGSKLIGVVEEVNSEYFILQHAGQLNFRIEPNGQQGFHVFASIVNPTIPSQYALSKAAIRGTYVNDSLEIRTLYLQYVKRASAGEFHLNPAAARKEIVLTQGNGLVEAVEGKVQVLDAEGKPATPVAEVPNG